MENTDTGIFNFADNNTLSASANSIMEVKQILENAAKEALKWLDSNQMIANPDKFKVIILKKPSITTDNINVTVGNQKIKPDASVKLLGVDIDDKLNFKTSLLESRC